MPDEVTYPEISELTGTTIVTDLWVGPRTHQYAAANSTTDHTPQPSSSSQQSLPAPSSTLGTYYSHSTVTHPMSPNVPPAPTTGANPTPTVGVAVGTASASNTATVSPMAFLAERSWEQVVYLACGQRGPAVKSLTDHLCHGQTGLQRVHATAIAVELLQCESVATCETIQVLLKDGWSGILGELLTCARKLTHTNE